MKRLESGQNQLTLEDGYDYDLVIPDNIDRLGYMCTSLIPDKIRNVIVGSNTTGEGSFSSYSFDNLTKANVIYDGEDTQAPWGAKSLNGVDATYTPYIMGGFDNNEIVISNDQSSTPIAFKLVIGNVNPIIMTDKLNSCLLDSITAQLNNTNVTSEVLACIEFESQPVFDQTWGCYIYTFTTKPGSELSAAINEQNLNITAILKDPTDSSKTYTWDNIMLILSQTAEDINITNQVTIMETSPYTEYIMEIPEVNRKYIKNLTIRGFRFTIYSLNIIDVTTGELIAPTSIANNIATFDNIDIYLNNVQSTLFRISINGSTSGSGAALQVYNCIVGNSIDQ